MKVLVFSSSGQLAKCLRDQLESSSYETVFVGRDICDLSITSEIEHTYSQFQPHVVINAAAYTSVDSAESNFALADAVNNLAVAELARLCNLSGATLIHVSTDYVFNGVSDVPYKEVDHTNPTGVYGATKLAGELSIKSSGCKFLILRTAWVFSEYGHNFLKTMLRVGASKNEMSIVEDQIGCPTYAQDIAGVIYTFLEGIEKGNLDSDIYHFCGDVSCSWYDFAEEIFNVAKESSFEVPSHLIPIATENYPTPASRPKYSVLDCSKIKHEIGIEASDWKLGIRKSIAALV